MNLKNGKVFTSKSVGTGPSSYEKRVYRAAVSQKLRNTALDDHQITSYDKHLRLIDIYYCYYILLFSGTCFGNFRAII